MREEKTGNGLIINVLNNNQAASRITTEIKPLPLF